MICNKKLSKSWEEIVIYISTDCVQWKKQLNFEKHSASSKSHWVGDYFSILLHYEWHRGYCLAGVRTLHRGTYFTNLHILASGITSFYSKTFCVYETSANSNDLNFIHLWKAPCEECGGIRILHVFSENFKLLSEQQQLASFMIGKTPFVSACFDYLKIKNNRVVFNSD